MLSEAADFEEDQTQRFVRSHLLAAAGMPAPPRRRSLRSSGTLEPRVSDVGIEEIQPDLEQPAHPAGRIVASIALLRRVPTKWTALAAAAAGCVCTLVGLAILQGGSESAAHQASAPATVLIDGERSGSRDSTAGKQAAPSPQVTDEPLTLEGSPGEPAGDKKDGAKETSEPDDDADSTKKPAKRGKHQTYQRSAPRARRRLPPRRFFPTDI